MVNLVVKTTILTLLALVAFCVVVTVINLFFFALLRSVGLSDDHLQAVKWLLLMALFFVPWKKVRIKRPFTLSATTVIDAPIEAVWNAVMPRPTTRPFRRFYSEVRAVEGSTDRFHFIPNAAISGDMPGVGDMELRIVDYAPYEQLSLAHDNHEDQGHLGIGASIETYGLEIVPEGVRVSLVEVVEHVSLWLLVTCLVVNPAKDTLRSLKHHCEGTEDISWMAMQMRDLTENDGQTTKNTVVIAGTTACVVLTAATFGIVFLVLSLGS